ncbi:uncharacterized protein LOC121796710 [Salvia splendens]|uniref:uncharacterized protein LOC121796710 n=1 Tax=Salvia splendens TaxID=180675 RepID=UPI001C2697CD|nr:uncharacterized protein LOC121796710 [Salvia splendens]
MSTEAGGNGNNTIGSSSAATNTSMLAPVSTSRVMAQAEKPEKFKGSEFKRWQQKMLFYLTTLGVANFLKEDAPTVPKEETDFNVRAAYDVWHQGDFLCKNYILNGLEDSLYSIFAGAKTSKVLWEALDKKYRVENAGTKKYVVAKFLDYEMVDSRSVVAQAEELQIIVHDVQAEGMALPDQFIVSSMIEKLHPWKATVGRKFEGNCFNCDKPGHMAKDCRKPKKMKFKKSAQMVERDFNDDDPAAVVSEVNHIDNPKAWFVDTGATVHVCSNRSQFSTYKQVEGKKLHMGNQDSSEVIGMGK